MIITIVANVADAMLNTLHRMSHLFLQGRYSFPLQMGKPRPTEGKKNAEILTR